MLLRILPTAPRGGGIITLLCSGGNWDAKRPPWSKEEAPKTGSLRSREAIWPPFFSAPVFGWLAPKRNFRPTQKERGKPWAKRKSKPLPKQPTQRLPSRSPVPLRSQCSPTIPSVSDSIHWPGETTQTTEPAGFFLLEVMLKVGRDALIQQELHQGRASNLGGKRRALRKPARTDREGRGPGHALFWNV